VYARSVHLSFLCHAAASAAETTLFLDGEVPTGGADHFRVPFEVPAGTRELEVRHDDGSEVDILDWGLEDPRGVFRGWGGGNSEPAVVSASAASRSYVPGPLPAGTWSVVVGKAKLTSPVVRWSVEIVLRDEVTLPPQPERRPFEDPGALRAGRAWYAGDFHVHSRESGDASATLDEIAALAVEQGLDFVVITDHDTVTGADFLTDAQARWPELLLVPGTEYTTYQGHATAFGATRWVDHKLGLDGLTIEDAVAAYRADGVFFSLNHPALELGDLCIGCAWTLPVPEGVGGIEVATGAAEPFGAAFTPVVLAQWESLADEGRLLTPLGGSDDHRAGQDEGLGAARIGNPVTMVLADELSIGALGRALERGDTAVKLRDRFDPLAELAVEGPIASLRVTGGAGGEVRWIVNGAQVGSVAVGGTDEVHEREGSPGERVRAEVWVGGVMRTVTAFRVFGDAGPEPRPKDRGCGCSQSGGGLPGVLVAAVLASLRVRRVRRSMGPPE
jgi:hypothetical protein